MKSIGRIIFGLLPLTASYAENGYQTIEQVEKYHRESTSQYERAMKALEPYAFTGHERVLDLGCGDGKITKAIADKLKDGLAVGVDISSKMLEFASKTFPYSSYPNLLFIHGDATSLNCFEQFDLVVSFNCLQRVQHLETVFKEVHASLKDEGHFIGVVVTRSNPYVRAHFILAETPKWKARLEESGFQLGHTLWDIDEYQQALLGCGFDLLSMEVTEQEKSFSTHAEFAAFFKTVSTALTYLPERFHDEFIEDFIELMARERPSKHPQEVRLCFSELAFEVKKRVSK